MPDFDIAGPQIWEGQGDVLVNLSWGKTNLLEVGCWTGRSTSVLAQAAKEMGGKLTCVDWWQGSPGTQLDSVAKNADIFEIFKKNMQDLDLWDGLAVHKMKSEEAVKLFPDEHFDFIFIDADHRYEGISKDLELWYPKVQKGGMFCGHDYEGREWKEEYIHQDYVEDRHHGVIKAVNEKFKRECRGVNFGNGFWWVEK